MRETARLFQGEKVLVFSGILGIVLGLVFGVLVLVHGAAVPPEGDLSKPFSFDLAIGLFTISTAAILPLAGFGNKGRAVWRWVSVFTVWYAYGQESIQSLRGLDPRFSHHGSPIDNLFGLGFAVVSLMILVLFVILVLKIFRAKNGRPVLTLGIRYGLIRAFLFHHTALPLKR